MEKIRCDKFEFTLSHEGDVDSIRLPPLLFIPFVENAVKHNFDSENPALFIVSLNCEQISRVCNLKKRQVLPISLIKIPICGTARLYHSRILHL